MLPSEEALTNKYRYIRDYISIIDKQKKVVPLRPNWAQKKYAASQTARDFILKPRQYGFTTWCIAEGLAECLLNENHSFLIVAHDVPSTQAMLDRVRGMYERIPVLKPALIKDSAALLRFEHGAEILIATAGGKNPVRSRTIQRAHLSEFAFWEDPERVYVGISEAVPSPAEGGKIVIETTPLGMGSPAHAMWQQAKSGGSIYKPHFYNWWEAGIYELTPEQSLLFENQLDEEERKLFDRGASLEALAWRRMKLKEPGMGKSFNQEYPSNDLECWLTTDVLFFELEALSSLYARCKPPIETRQVGPFQVKLWEKPNKYSTYVMGSDVAEGLDSGDSSVSVLIEYQTGVHVATVIGKGDTDIFVDVSLDVADAFFRPIWAIERNSIGAAAVKHAEAMGYPNLYHRKTENYTQKPDPRAGWVTTSATRGPLLGELQAAVREGVFQTFDPEAVTEMQSFVWKDGKPRAAARTHDDIVMALAIAWRMRDFTSSRKRVRPTIVRGALV